MPSVNLSVTVPTTTCQKTGCTEDPENMVPTSAYRQPNGDIVCNGSRLPDGWVRMLTVNADGSETPLKVYCPVCAATL